MKYYISISHWGLIEVAEDFWFRAAAYTLSKPEILERHTDHLIIHF